jgi:hypothetical protein
MSGQDLVWFAVGAVVAYYFVCHRSAAMGRVV